MRSFQIIGVLFLCACAVMLFSSCDVDGEGPHTALTVGETNDTDGAMTNDVSETERQVITIDEGLLDEFRVGMTKDELDEVVGEINTVIRPGSDGDGYYCWYYIVDEKNEFWLHGVCVVFDSELRVTDWAVEE